MNNPIKQAFDKQFADIRMDEARMARLLNAHGTKTSKPRPFRKALVLALTLVIVAGVAYSASHFLGTVDWHGNKTREELAPAPTEAPQTSDDTEAQRLERLAHESLHRKPPEELWLAKLENGRWMSLFPRIRVNSFEQAKKLIGESASPLMLPESIPGEYAFQDGELSLYIDTKSYEALEPLPGESPAPGLTLRGYRLPREALGDFGGYVLSFVNKAGDTLRLEARMSGGDEDFGLWQGDKVSPAVIPGFDNALLFERTGWNQLFLRQTGFEPVSACRMDYFTTAPDRPDYPLEPEIFTSVTYILHNNTASGESISPDILKTLAKGFAKP